MTWLRCVFCIAPLLVACNDSDLVDPPPANAAIEPEEGERALPLMVQCEGPEEQLALLGDLCGSSSEQLSWSSTEIRRGKGMATAVGRGSARLMIYAEVEGDPEYNENVAARLAYAAYVVLDAEDPPGGVVPALEQWQDGEAVESGAVRTQSAFFEACNGESWVGEGTFVWRDTTLELGWIAGLPC